MLLNSNVSVSQPVNNNSSYLESFNHDPSTRKTKKHNQNSIPENTLCHFSSPANFLPVKTEIDLDLIQFSSPPSKNKIG